MAPVGLAKTWDSSAHFGFPLPMLITWYEGWEQEGGEIPSSFLDQGCPKSIVYGYLKGKAPFSSNLGHSQATDLRI